MTQSRSSILFALAVLIVRMIVLVVVVESATTNININEDVENISKVDDRSNQTNHVFQINDIDSDLKETEAGSQSPHQNTTTSNDIIEESALKENIEDNVKNKLSLDILPAMDSEQSEELMMETTGKVDNLTKTIETVPKEIANNMTELIDNEEKGVKDEVYVSEIPTTATQKSKEQTNHTNEQNESLKEAIDEGETTTSQNLNEIITTTSGTIIENISTIDSTVESMSTQISDIPGTSTINNSEKLHDLSIYFENEPNRARQLRGFNKESDNELIVSNSDSSSNISKSLESETNHSSEVSSEEDENKAIEQSSASENFSNEQKTLELKNEPFDIEEEPQKSTPENSVEVIESVTESTGEMTSDVTVLTNVETHTIMKKPGVEDEFSENSEVLVTNSGIGLDSVVSLVLNRSQEILEQSPTTISPAENQVTENKISSYDTQKELEKVEVPPIASASINAEGSDTNIPEEVASTSPSIDQSTDVKITTIPVDKEHVLNEQITLPELLKPTKPHPENQTISQNEDSGSQSNGITYSEKHDDINIDDNILAVNEVTSTKASSQHTEDIQEQKDQPNGIFKESKDDGSNFTLKNVESSTEKEIVANDKDSINALSEHNQVHTITDFNTLADPSQSINDKTFPSTLNEQTSNGLNEEASSGLNSIPYTESDFSTDHIETSTEAPSGNNFESEPSGEIQEDQKQKTENGNNINLSTIDESLPDPKLYEEPYETFTKNPAIYKIDVPITETFEKSQFGTTTNYARHIDSLQTMRDESSSSVVSNEVIAPASVGRSFNDIVAEGLGKPLPTRSVGDEPSSSSYSSEDKTTTVIVLCAATGGIFIAFSFAIYLISFQRQHGTLDIEMQEQRCGKDNLDEDDDSETRVSLLNKIPTMDSDEHSSD